MKKKLAALIAAASVLSLAGCSGNTSSTSSATDSVSTTESSVSTDSSAAESTDDTASAENSEPEIEEIPYTLGGELTPAMLANSVYNEGNLVRLANVIKKLQNGGEVTVAYLGGSITQGSSAGDDLCYARLTTNWLEEHYPEAKINYVRAGIGATGSYIGVHRADRDVLCHNPDLVFIDFSVNDTTERTATNMASYESLLRKLWKHESSPAIVTIAMTQQDGTSFIDYHGEIVKKYDIPMINYRAVILDVIDKGYIQWTDISDDNIHPNVPGHAVLSQLITSFIQSVENKLDTITGAETDFNAIQPGENGDKYENASLLTCENTQPASLGAFQLKEAMFGNVSFPWIAKSSDGVFGDDSALVFEVEAKNIGILYGKLTKNFTKAEIYVDGELAATVDADFTGGWGSYTEYADIISFEETGAHTVAIKPVDTDKTAAFYVNGLCIS
ncbi:MAG: SGNH/GDSL hydrolase family protein [Oscillospiraceae bacterium]